MSYLAIDIGGTKTSVVTFSNLGLKKRPVKFPTSAEVPDFLLKLQAALNSALPTVELRQKVQMIIIAFPGIIQNGLPTIAPNLPAWTGTALADGLTTLFSNFGFSCPFYFENDANLGAFYEAKNKKGRAVYLTFSTGIGGGIVENGRLAPASANFEPGKYPFNYNNQQATWESFSSVRAINASNNVDDIKKITDSRAFFDIASRVSLGVSQIVREQSPAFLIIGGPIGLVWPRFQRQLKSIVAPAQNPSAPTKIVRAKKPMECVEYGCYYYAKAIEKALKAQQAQ